MDEFLDIESFVASTTDLLSPHDLDTFFFETKDISPKWLNDIFSPIPRSATNFDPPLAEEDKSMPVENRDVFSETQSCQNPQGLCFSLATELLKAMHACSSSCLLGMGSQDRQSQLSRAVDGVLSTNYEALQAIRGLLRCSCYTSPQLQLLVTIIFTETIAWYWRIIDTYSRCRNRNTDSGILHTERVDMVRRSFFIGEQCLESHLEATLIGQVVSSRLQELEDLIGEIAWSAEQSAAINSESESHPMHSAVHVRIDAFLNAQLAAVRRELVNLQKDCQSHNEEAVGQKHVHGSLRDNSRGPAA